MNKPIKQVEEQVYGFTTKYLITYVDGSWEFDFTPSKNLIELANK